MRVHKDMTDPIIPSVNPPNYGNLTGVFREVFRKLIQDTDDMLPASVISYDRTTGRAKVQPLIAIIKTDNSQIIRAPIASIPVLHLGGGGFVLDFPLNPGDLGWIKANDRDISIFLQQYDQSRPNTYRSHDFSDAVFIPDVMKGYTINEEDAGNVVLQTLDGTQRVSIWPDRIKITSNNEVIIDAPDANFTGRITAQGVIHSADDVTARTVSLHGHVHINGGGTGDSGPPAT
jgi:hypothetical protein